MSRGPGTFRPGELDGSDVNLGEADRAAAYAAARELESALPSDPPHSPVGFADRVMAAVASEPSPVAMGFLAGLLAHPSIRSFIGSLRGAWVVAASGVGRSAGARGLALAYVLAVVVIGTSLSGLAAYRTIGALGLLGVDRSPVPSASVPSPTSSLDGALPVRSADPDASSDLRESAEPTGSTGPAESAEPGGSAEPTESPGPSQSKAPSSSDDSAGSPKPTASPSPSAGATESPSPNPSPSTGDDPRGGSPLPSGSPTESPQPSATPNPSESPH
jgi:hypothetical protein